MLSMTIAALGVTAAMASPGRPEAAPLPEPRISAAATSSRIVEGDRNADRDARRRDADRTIVLYDDPFFWDPYSAWAWDWYVPYRYPAPHAVGYVYARAA